MAGKRYICKTCGAVFAADEEEGKADCSECGSEEIEGFVDALYANELRHIGEIAEAAGMSEKESVLRGDRGNDCGDAGTTQGYICRKCGFEFSAIPGAEQPPDCPECDSDEIDKLERATYGDTTKERGCNEKKD